MESSPSITVTLENGSTEHHKVTVRFQCGLLRETETFYGEDVTLLCRDTLLDYVADMLCMKFPEHPYGDLVDKLLLYRHEPGNKLVPFEADDPVHDGVVIDIVLNAQSKQEYDDTICPHILTVHTYRAPGTFCDYCGTVLFGLLKQGLKCEGCDKNFHKKCAYKIPNNCTRLKMNDGVSVPPPCHPRPKEVWSGRPLWIDRTLKSRQQVPHTFFVQTFKKPTQCYHCKKLMKGMFRQGLKCKDCGIGVHKKCSKELGSQCPGEVPSLNRVDSGEFTMASLARSVITNEYSLADDPSIVASNDTTASQPREQPAAVAMETPPTPSEGAREESPTSSSSSAEHFDPVESSYVGAPMDAIAEEREDSTSNEGSEHNAAQHLDSTDNIRLQRVTGVSMRHKKPPPASVLKEGWMVHYTNKSTIRKKHYWRLDTKCLTLYKSDTSSNYYREISLADILAVDQMVTPELYPLTPPHVFEIVTQPLTYYVGVDMTGALPVDLKPDKGIDPNSVNLLGDVSHMTVPQLEEYGVGLGVGIHWEEALHSALMPVTPQASMGSLADVGVASAVPRVASFRKNRGSLRGSLRGSFRGNRPSSFRNSMHGRKGSMRGSFRVPKERPGGGTPPVRTNNGPLKQPKVETKMDISLFYQIFPEEILGSGQFGTVFGGQNRQTSKNVAVKVIDKLRFPHKHESQLRTEVTILQALSHPGIIFLEQMFETPEKIYVVMEKMNGDMLEMILNSPASKLSERVTKFMTYQILMALQYLHKKDIVHCDLKPENVLLTAETGLPQAKLCDFGFARIIGEKSFRKSIVGTPAYLAPEVLKNEGYNRSLDLWSVGVIVYVSLSGTFPFNEDEEISDQIQNAAFMYPPDPWANISSEAMDIINRLLQVSRKSRFKATQAVNHVWMRDLQLWEDLCALEGRLGMRYLTHETEDPFWEDQGAKPHPLASQRPTRSSTNSTPVSHTPTSTPPTPRSNHTPSPSSRRAVKFNNDSPLPERGEEKIGAGSAMYFLNNPTPKTEELKSEDSSDTRSRSSSERGTSVHKPDEEIIKVQEHAERIGYKVSTV